MHALLRTVVPLALAFAGACSAPRSTVDDGRLAPWPYTPEEIRDAHPAGMELVFRLEAPGAPAVLQRMRFIECDADGALYESATTDLHGAPLGRPETKRATWIELRDHASYPAVRTKLSEETCEVAAGRYECTRYRVDETQGGGAPAHTTYWFAKSKPGPPVLIVTEEAGEVVLRMELVELRRT